MQIFHLKPAYEFWESVVADRHSVALACLGENLVAIEPYFSNCVYLEFI